MSAPLLQVEGLEIAYRVGDRSVAAVTDFDLSVRPGEIVGIVGESGSGKSTVAAALLRLLPPNGRPVRGTIAFRDRDLNALGDEELRRLRGHEIGMIFQDTQTSLNPTFSIGKQLVDAQKAHLGRGGVRSSELRRRAIEKLEQVGIPDAAVRIDNYPHEFSGGMRQRIAIATMLLLRPALLVADEPTSALDVTLEVQILELLRDLRTAQGTAIVFISHDLGVIRQLCDRVVVMYAGRAVEEGEVGPVFDRPLHPYTRALLAAVPSVAHRGRRLAIIPGRVPNLAELPPGCAFADRDPYAQTVCQEREPAYLAAEGRRVRCHIYDPLSDYDHALLPASGPVFGSRDHPARAHSLPTAAEGNRGVLLGLRGVRTHYTERPSFVSRFGGGTRAVVRAVDGVDLDVFRGETLGLVGESGSGKTTLGETILRLTPPTSGEIVYDGKDLTRMRSRELRKLRRRIQMIFQDPYASLSPRLTVAALLTEPYAINDMPTDQRYSVAELLEMVRLSSEQARKYPHELSGGQARRVGIARALTLLPEFIVADEPTSGLDVSAAAAILSLMQDLGERLGLTYLLITHNLNVLGYVVDRIAVMYLGRIVEVGPAERVLADPAHPYTLALLSALSESNAQRRDGERRLLVRGEIPSPSNPPSGCRFHTRCPFAEERSRREVPELEEIEPGHYVACHFWPTVRARDGRSIAPVVGVPE